MRGDDHVGACGRGAIPPGVEVRDLNVQAEALRGKPRMPVLGIGVGQHHRTAVDTHMDVHGAALVVGRNAGDVLRPEGLDVEIRRLVGAVDGQVGRDPARDFVLPGFSRGGFDGRHETSPVWL
jgi:hypothetical protein